MTLDFDGGAEEALKIMREEGTEKEFLKLVKKGKMKKAEEMMLKVVEKNRARLDQVIESGKEDIV